MTNHPNRGNIKDWPIYIRTFRQRNDLTQVELADKLYVTEAAVQHWERGIRTPAPYLKRALRDLARELTLRHSP